LMETFTKLIAIYIDYSSSNMVYSMISFFEENNTIMTHTNKKYICKHLDSSNLSNTSTLYTNHYLARFYLKFTLLLLTCFLSLLVNPSFGAEFDNAQYILGVGDKIEVSVWRNEDLNKEVTIRPDGWLSLPLAGEIKAVDMLPEQLKNEVSLRLAKYIKDPQVSIIVSGFGSQRILILGEVKRPGIYRMSRPLTVLEALATAEGYKEFAHLRSVLVIRKAYSDSPKILSANLLNVISKGDLKEDIPLKAGDIVFVPKKFVGKIKDFLSFFNDNIKPLADTYINYRHVEAIENLADSE